MKTSAKKLSLACMTVMALIFNGQQARAEQTTAFDFMFSGTGISISGTLNASSNGDGSYTAIDGIGTVFYPDTSYHLNLEPVGSTGDSDNIIFFYLTSSDFHVTGNGLTFSMNSFNGDEINVFSTPLAGYGIYHNGSFKDVDTFSSASITAVSTIPEPETYAMILAGLGGLGLVTRRRKSL